MSTPDLNKDLLRLTYGPSCLFDSIRVAVNISPNNDATPPSCPFVQMFVQNKAGNDLEILTIRAATIIVTGPKESRNPPHTPRNKLNHHSKSRRRNRGGGVESGVSFI